MKILCRSELNQICLWWWFWSSLPCHLL